MKVLLILVLALALAEPALAASAPKQADSQAGKAKYETLCVGCHGTGGKGDGPAAGGLNPKPADLSNPAYAQSLTDAYLFEIIREGGPKVKKSPLMPGWLGALNEKDIWNVIAYLRTLAAPKPAQ